jgi:phage-related holin
MIQRIQSLFLLLVTVLMTIAIFSPIGCFVGNLGGWHYALMTIKDIHPLLLIKFPLWIILALSIITVLGSLVTALLYKNRKLQMKLSIAGIAVLAIIYAVVIAYISVVNGQVGSEFHPSFIMSFPGISMGSYLLAIIFIRKDEKLVKSTDRIR